MKDPDASIDRVIAGLRASEPPAGMNARILRTMQDRAPAPAGTRWRAWKVAAISVACALIVTTLLLGHRFEHEPVPPAKQLTTAHAGASTASPRLDSERQAVPLSLQARLPEPTAANRPRTRRASVFAPRMIVAADHPAPPLPLTEQERLLLQLAQHRRAEALLLLNPETQAKQLAEDNEKFQQFFAKPTEEEILAQRPGGL